MFHASGGVAVYGTSKTMLRHVLFYDGLKPLPALMSHIDVVVFVAQDGSMLAYLSFQHVSSDGLVYAC
jgi:hypothetical protein